jgi:hypothetical protein
VSDLRNLANSVQAIADEISGGKPSETTQAETSAINKEEKPETKAVTLEQVRAMLAAKSHDGFTAEVRALLEKHGASRLSEIDPANYPALLADAEGLK